MKTEPWLCPKANNFLVKYFEEHKDPYVLEFGIGGSTVWFSQKTKHLCSVEHDSKWYNDLTTPWNLFRGFSLSLLTTSAVSL